MVDNIDPLWLRSFHRVFEHASFKVAAQQLGLPSSNVSRHIALLEEALNARLLERTTRSVRPTEAGEKLYQSSTVLLSALNQALVEVGQFAETVSGQLKLLMPDIPVLADATVSFCTSHPGVSISCDTSLSPNESLLDGFDLVMSFNRGRLEDKGWVSSEILRLPSVVVAAPSLIERVGTPSYVNELEKLPCISSLTALSGMPWVFKGADSPWRQTVNAEFKVNSGYMAKAAALNGLGMAILPQMSCQQEIAEGRLIEIELEKKPEDLVLYAFYAGRKHIAKKITAYIAHLKTHLAKVDDEYR